VKTPFALKQFGERNIYIKAGRFSFHLVCQPFQTDRYFKTVPYPDALQKFLF
jgi:hypothetical protein